MGVLAAHTTSINANGEANSSMHLAFPRLVWDPENLEDVESLLSYQIDSDTDSVLSDAHKFSAFEEDPVPYLEN
ncbi:MAG: hypothetical protein H8E12_14755 [Rhodobacteraceae bacterium]|nr:hypothetical protein [Paracoccaceae bacterium]